MSFAAVLRSYATQKDPSRHLPASVHLLSNDDALTIFDKYPKAKYHFLVLPRWPFTAKEDEDSGRNEDGEPSVCKKAHVSNPFRRCMLTARQECCLVSAGRTTTEASSPSPRFKLLVLRLIRGSRDQYHRSWVPAADFRIERDRICDVYDQPGQDGQYRGTHVSSTARSAPASLESAARDGG